jgi:hypothetical protein
MEVTEIQIRCRFNKFKHLVCDKDGVFWILPHRSGKRYVSLRKVIPVEHMKKPHINYKEHRVSLDTLRRMAKVVNEVYKPKTSGNGEQLPF